MKPFALAPRVVAFCLCCAIALPSPVLALRIEEISETPAIQAELQAGLEEKGIKKFLIVTDDPKMVRYLDEISDMWLIQFRKPSYLGQILKTIASIEDAQRLYLKNRWWLPFTRPKLPFDAVLIAPVVDREAGFRLAQGINPPGKVNPIPIGFVSILNNPSTDEPNLARLKAAGQIQGYITLEQGTLQVVDSKIETAELGSVTETKFGEVESNQSLYMLLNMLDKKAAARGAAGLEEKLRGPQKLLSAREARIVANRVDRILAGTDPASDFLWPTEYDLLRHFRWGHDFYVRLKHRRNVTRDHFFKLENAIGQAERRAQLYRNGVGTLETLPRLARVILR